MQLTPEEKKEVKELIESDMHNLHEDLDTAKNDIDAIAAVVEEKYGIKKAKFKKVSKMHYLASLEEEKAKAEEVFDLYEELLN